MTPNQQTLDKYQTNLDKMTRFLSRWEHKLDPDLGIINISPDSARYTVFLRYRDEHERIKALVLLGEVFGRDGWTIEEDRSAEADDWTRTIDEVIVTIYGAEQWPAKPKDRLVPITKWPIALMETNSNPERTEHERDSSYDPAF